MFNAMDMERFSYNEDILKVFEPNEVWFTSDTHFYHENILRFCSRPYGLSRR